MYLRISLTNLCETLRDFEKLRLGPCSCGHLLGVYFSSGGLLQSKLQSKLILKINLIVFKNNLFNFVILFLFFDPGWCGGGLVRVRQGLVGVRWGPKGSRGGLVDLVG